MNRREVLPSVGIGAPVGVAGLAGCASLGSQYTDDDDTREVVVNNEMDHTVHVAVRVEASDGESLFGHGYELDPGKTDQSAGDGEVDAKPATVDVFTTEDETRTWEYTADTDLPCDTQDIGIRVRSDTIQFYNNC